MSRACSTGRCWLSWSIISVFSVLPHARGLPARPTLSKICAGAVRSSVGTAYTALSHGAVGGAPRRGATVRGTRARGFDARKTSASNPLTALFGTSTPQVIGQLGLLLAACVLASSSLTSFLEGALLHLGSRPLLIEVDILVAALLIFCWAPRFRGQAVKKPILAVAELTEASENHNPTVSSTAARRRKALRVQLRKGMEELQRVVKSLGDGADCDQDFSRISCVFHRAGLHDFHAVPAAGLLLPIEVAACRFGPDVSEHLQRRLQDRWAVADRSFGCAGLASIPE